MAKKHSQNSSIATIQILLVSHIPYYAKLGSESIQIGNRGIQPLVLQFRCSPSEEGFYMAGSGRFTGLKSENKYAA